MSYNVKTLVYVIVGTMTPPEHYASESTHVCAVVKDYEKAKSLVKACNNYTPYNWDCVGDDDYDKKWCDGHPLGKKACMLSRYKLQEMEIE